jgi:glycerate kinase
MLNDIAYIELAKASGLQLLNEQERNPMVTTTYGTGEMIADAINRGAKKIYLFVGGSATNDAGIGIANALGYVFLDKGNRSLEPIGKNLIKIRSINSDNLISISEVDIILLTDVNNILFGPNGAACVFALQKGADKNEIDQLDKGLKNLAEVVKSSFDMDVANIPGGGAAGGVGAGLVAFCNASIKNGIETILNILSFDKYAKMADIVITGEGLLDKQTLEGKVVKGVIDHCEKFEKPLGVVCGDLVLSQKELGKLHISIIKSLRTPNISKDESIQNAFQYLVKRSEELIINYLKT